MKENILIHFENNKNNSAAICTMKFPTLLVSADENKINQLQLFPLRLSFKQLPFQD